MFVGEKRGLSPQGLFKPLDRFSQAFLQGNGWLPAKKLACQGDVGFASGWVIFRERFAYKIGRFPKDAQDAIPQLSNGNLVRVADVHRGMDVGTQKSQQPFNEVGDKAKRSGL